MLFWPIATTAIADFRAEVGSNFVKVVPLPPSQQQQEEEEEEEEEGYTGASRQLQHSIRNIKKKKFF